MVEPPSAETLAAIVANRHHGATPASAFTLTKAELLEAFDTVERVVLPEAVANWIARLVAASHPTSAEAPDVVKTGVTYGASPRAAIALAEAARAYALLAGRPSVGFDDVRAVAFPVFNHRLILDYRAKLDGVTSRTIVDALLTLLVTR